jgi:hypothetical protein
MFAVFAHTMGEEEVSGRGFTPQYAWESMLGEFAIEEYDIDLDSVVFFREVSVTRETKITWLEPVSDTDDE